MGYSEKTRIKLENIINQGKTKEERVKLSFKAGFQVLTKPVSDGIRADYDAVNKAIESLDSKDPLMGKKKNDLLELKREIPYKRAITNAEKFLIQEIINNILSQK